jgi:hypothetical protein
MRTAVPPVPQVHLSFVRSVSMDSWTDAQLEIMRVRFGPGAGPQAVEHREYRECAERFGMLQVGGNALMRQAFDGAGLPRGLSIKVSRSARSVLS